MHSTEQLVRTPLWQTSPETWTFEGRVKLSYRRLRTLIEHFEITSDDIEHLSEKYWDMASDPIMAVDASVYTLLMIHFNLCTGTILKFASGRPDLQGIVDKLLKLELSGQFCLTEVGHGLDVVNMETTATMSEDGSFVLNTPVARAAKFMPPTSPCGIPVIAVVFARLIVSGEDRGPRPFLVQLNDGTEMSPGVVCKVLSPLGGCRPVQHAITYFHNVRLPSAALLGSPERPESSRNLFFFNISRVAVGALCIASTVVNAVKISSYIAGMYSMRRMITDASTRTKRPIISFSTQYIPVLTGIAQGLVADALKDDVYRMFIQADSKDLTYRNFLAALLKVINTKFAVTVPVTLGDRCGVQGLFEVNQFVPMHSDSRAAQIAEGDVVGTSIRFAMEVLLGRIVPPSSSHPESVLARHETAMLTELGQMIPTSTHSHRAAEVEARLLPHAQPLIEAIGYRMAYDAAIKAKLNLRLVDLFVASAIKSDPAWYSENIGLSRARQAEEEGRAAAALLPELPTLLKHLNVEAYATAPIVDEGKWEEHVKGLETLDGLGTAENGRDVVQGLLFDDEPSTAEERTLYRSRL